MDGKVVQLVQGARCSRPMDLAMLRVQGVSRDSGDRSDAAMGRGSNDELVSLVAARAVVRAGVVRLGPRARRRSRAGRTASGRRNEIF
jgi:hypothetical protein